MSTWIALLFVIFPGALVANWTTPRTGDGKSFLCESIVWSLLLGSVYAWVPGGFAIPLSLWTGLLLILTVAGLVIAIRRTFAAHGAHFRANVSWDTVPVVALFLVYAFILLGRAVIDWDAITYYFTVALEFVFSGHATATLFPFVSTVPGAPNLQPPVMPAVYANAFELARWFQEAPENAVRLTPIAFLIGGYFATRRLAEHYLHKNGARLAALLWLALPATIHGVSFFPLYLDLGITFLCTLFISELVRDNDDSWHHYFRLGVIASTVALFKVNGFALLVLATIAMAIVRANVKIGRVSAIIVLALILGFTAAVGLLSPRYPLELVIGVMACSAVFYAAAAASNARTSFTLTALLACAAGFAPGILRAIQLTITVGSPAGYYIPALVHNTPTAWKQAVALLSHADIYASFLEPGLPGNYAPGLLLWWGFSPVIGLLAGTACVLAIRRKQQISELAAIAALFDLAYLTVFQYGGMRDLLPVVPLISILAAYTICAFGTSTADRRLLMLFTLLSIVPFAWNGQEFIFGDALAVAKVLGWNAWQAFSTRSLLTETLFGGIILASAWLVSSYALRFPVVPSLIKRLQRSLHAQVTLVQPARASWLIAGIICLLFFIPLWLLALRPGIAKQRDILMNSEDFGYLPVLVRALADHDVRRLLTYKAYGTTWFSGGRVGRIDIADGTDLAYYSREFAKTSPSEIIGGMDVQGSILPAPQTTEHTVLERVLSTFHYDDVSSLDDPLIGHASGNANWRYTKFYHGTTQAISASDDPMLYAETVDGEHESISDSDRIIQGEASAGKTLVVEGLPSEWNGHYATVSTLAIPADDDPFAEELHSNIKQEVRNGILRISFDRWVNGLVSTQSVGKRSDLRMLEIRISVNPASGVLDFRSGGFDIASRPKSWTISGLPFVLHPEWNVVKEISIVEDGQREPVQLFPLRTKGFSQAAARVLRIQFRPSPVCRQPNNTRVALSYFYTSQGQRHAEQAIATARRRSVDFDIPLLSGIKNGIVVQGISISGTDSKCRVQERIASRSLGLGLVSGNAVSGSYSVEPLHEVFVRLAR